MSERLFFMAHGDERIGPLRPDELMKRGLTRDSLVWADGMPEWVPAARVPEICAIRGGVPPAPPGEGPPACRNDGAPLPSDEIDDPELTAGWPAEDSRSSVACADAARWCARCRFNGRFPWWHCLFLLLVPIANLVSLMAIVTKVTWGARCEGDGCPGPEATAVDGRGLATTAKVVGILLLVVTGVSFLAFLFGEGR